MNLLDQAAKIRRWDKKWQVLVSIEKLPDQFFQVWREIGQIKVPAGYAKAANIIMMGMGGSGLTAHLIQSLYYHKLNLPLQLVNGYSLPAYANRDSLVVITSYSGNTEEALAVFKEALLRKTKIFVITTDGQLSKLAKKYGVPRYYIDDELNFSEQPRLGSCYMLAAQLAVLKKCGLIRFTEKELHNLEEVFKKFSQRFSLDNPLIKNPAKTIAQQVVDKIIIGVAAEFLNGNAHILANQINESANNFAVYFQLPEINHHLFDGLAHPGLNRRVLKFIFIESDLYHENIQFRFTLTKEVLAKKNIGFLTYKTKSLTRLGQTIEVLLFSSYLSFYLAILNRENPQASPLVEYFKKRLAKTR